MIRPQTCPICEKELPANLTVDSPLFPFCSERCRNVDLLRWAEGHYQIVDPLQPHHLEDLDLDEDEPPAMGE